MQLQATATYPHTVGDVCHGQCTASGIWYQARQMSEGTCIQRCCLLHSSAERESVLGARRHLTTEGMVPAQSPTTPSLLITARTTSPMVL